MIGDKPSATVQVYAGPLEAVTWGDDRDARWPGFSPIEPIGHTHRSPLPTVLNVKAIPRGILEEVIV